MSGSFQKKTSSLMVTAFIGLIIISFMFTGYNSMSGTPDTVASVGGSNIRYREFKTEYDRLVQFYGQMFGNQPLPTAQLRGLRTTAINNLVARKRLAKFAEHVGSIPSSDEVKAEIKNLPYFQRNGKFDIGLYKTLLTNARLTPSDFETDIAESLKHRGVSTFFNSFPLSNSFANELKTFKENQIYANVARVNKTAMVEYLTVSKKEVREYLKDETNSSRVKDLFGQRKSIFDQKEEVKASHILLKTTPETEAAVKKKIDSLHKKLNKGNFASLANKNTEDPSGKKKGGDLGWFSRGRMVPEFEKTAFGMSPGQISKPVKTQFGYHIIYVRNKKAAKEAKLANHQNKLAKELIKKSKKDELSKLVGDITGKLQRYLERGQTGKITALQKKYSFQFEKGMEINQLDGVLGPITLTPKQIEKVFQLKSSGTKVEKFEEPLFITLVAEGKAPKKKAEKFDIEKEKKSRSSVYSQKFRQSIMKELEKTVPAKVFENRIQI